MKRLFFPAVLLAVVVFCSFRVHATGPSHVIYTLRLSDTGDLPDSYKNRHFINDPQVLIADPTTLPGNIVKWNASTSAYEFVTLTAIIKGHKAAVTQPIANGLVYNGTVESTSSLNGSDLIADVKADKGQVIDIEIRDNASYAVPDGQIDTAAIRSAMQSVSADDRKNLFYVSSATVSIITYKVHAAPPVEGIVGKSKKEAAKLAKADTAKKGGLYVKLTPSKKPDPVDYGSSGSGAKALTDKTLSVQLIPVNDMTAQAPVKK